jgi:hypothetical protein
MTPPRIKLLDDLGAEFERVGRVHERRGRDSRRRSWRTPVLATVLALLLAGGAVAAGVVLDRPDNTTRLLGSADRRGLAQGTTSDGRPWLLSAARDNGAFCRSLRVGVPDQRPQAAVNCGGLMPGTFGATTSNPGSPSSSDLLFGTAPDNAAVVTVGASTRFQRKVAVVDDTHAVDGKFFVVELAAGTPADGLVSLFRIDGKPLGDPVTLDQLIERGSP